MTKKRTKRIFGIVGSIVLILTLAGIAFYYIRYVKPRTLPQQAKKEIASIADYEGSPYIVLNDNIPYFTQTDCTTVSYAYYGELDKRDRCSTCIACVGKDIMPTTERGSIGQVKPSGWQIAKYDFVEGKYLYNRCHLIGYQLTGENANEKNLITGTRYMNTQGMLPFENMVADYVKETNYHVLYRVTPIFDGNNLVANGVLMEAYSVEDSGEGICFCVYCYNVQPGVTINYKNGDSEECEEQTDTKEYILNKGTHKFHLPTCSSVEDIQKDNKETYRGSREILILQGYEPCKGCNP